MTLALAIAADIATVWIAFEALRRYFKPSWLLSLGYWFNAHYWGPRADIWFGSGHSCWVRILPHHVCQGLASLLLLKVERAARTGGSVHEQLTAQKEILDLIEQKRQRITQRHNKRGWNGHPHHCRNPNPPRWCRLASCHRDGTVRVLTSGEPARWFCHEHKDIGTPWGDETGVQNSTTQ